MLVPLALPCPDLVSSCLALPTPSSSFPIPRYTPPIRTATPLANGSRVAPAATRCLNLGCLFATEPTAQRRGPADRPLCSLYATCSCRPNPTAPRIVFFFFSLFLRTMTQSSRVARVLTSVARMLTEGEFGFVRGPGGKTGRTCRKPGVFFFSFSEI